MDWLPIVAVFAMIFVVPLWMDRKKVKSPLAWSIFAIGFIASILWLKGWLGDAVILLLAGLEMLDHIPRFIGWVVFGIIVYVFYEYRFRVTTAAVLEVLAEVEKTNARIELLENSVRHIRSQLPEPEYLKELRKEAFRD
ncbi:MAG: hypothetical protein ACLQM6_13380 [Acidobacteriaceae bacterium]